MRMISAGLGLVVVVGCATEPVEVPLDRVDLRQAMAAGADVQPVGVAIAPNGQRFVFDEQLGLYRIDGQVATAIVPWAQLPGLGTPFQPPFTDVVAIAPDVFALTAIGDGFLLDTAALTLTQHFCYVPEGFPEDLTQRTDAISYDPVLDRIYAQPRTFDRVGTLQFAQLAGYERPSGIAVEWHNVDNDMAAGGMTVIPDVGLVLGQGSRLDRFDLAAGTTQRLDDLGRFGIHSIQGLAIDATAGTLIVVDGGTDELIEVELARLAL